MQKTHKLENAMDITILRLTCVSRNMTSIHISNSPMVTDHAIMTLARKCSKLVDVTLSGCGKITDASIIFLAMTHPNLTSLNLDKCGNVTDATAVTLANHCAGLRCLNLSCTCVADVGVVELAKKCKHLHSIQIGWCVNVTDRGIKALAQGCKHLRHIDVSSTNATDESVVELSNKCLNLHNLCFNECVNVTDAGVIALAQKCLKLKYVNLSATGVTSRGVQALSDYCGLHTRMSGTELKRVCATAL